MGTGIVNVDAYEVMKWFIAGKRYEDIRELLLLPESYSVERIYEPTSKEEVTIVLSSPDIPEGSIAGHSVKIFPHYAKDKSGKKQLTSIEMFVPPRTITVPYDQPEVALR